MRLPDHLIDQVRDSNDIVEVVSDYVALKKKGANFFGLCPFHGEKTPSFSVNPDRGIYKCFGCGKGGNAFNFLMEIENIGFVEAVRLLADRANITLPEPSREGAQVGSELESIYHALRMAGRFFHEQLVDSQEGEAARSYLERRGFSEETIRKFGLGYAPDSWDALIRHADAEKTSIEHLDLAGLVVKSEKRSGHYDRFRGRIMFPFFTHVGQVVGFTGRLLDDATDQPKYVNSPETKVYHKSRILYGLNLAKNEIRRSEEAYIVEGNTDVISLVQSGIPNVIATSGTALTPNQVKLVGRYTDTVVLLFDSDSAGVRATLRTIDLFLSAGMRVYALALPEGTDPDSYVQEHGRDGFLDYAGTNRTNFVSFQLDAAGFKRFSGDPESDWEAIQPVLASIARIPNAVRREGYVRVAAELTGMSEATLRDGLRSEAGKVRRQASRERRRPVPPSTAANPEPVAAPTAAAATVEPLTGERDLIRLMLLHRDRMIGYVLANMSLDEFTEGPSRRSAGLLLEMYQKGEVDTERILSGEVSGEIAGFVAGLMIQREQPSPNWRSIHDIEVPPLDVDAKRSASDAMKRLKIERVDRAIAEQTRMIREMDGANEDVREHVRQLQSLQALRKQIARAEFVEWDGQ